MPDTPAPIATAPWLDALLWATLVVAILWLLLDGLAAWRRKATGLTVASTASDGSTPAFLGMDHKERQAALDRADQFEAKLTERETRQKAEVEGKAFRAERTTGFMRTTQMLAVFMSFFSLATLIAGAIWQVSWLGVVWEKWSASGRMIETLKAHPFAVAVCLIVITFHVLTFVRERRWTAS